MSLQRVRIVCISDTHNQTPKLPSGDILIHAGDLTNQGSYSELLKTIDWLKKADFRLKIIIAGNHDVSLHSSFYEEYGQYFHNQKTESPDQCIDLFRSAASNIHYLDHEAKIVFLENSDGTRAKIKVFGSPYSPSRGLWAFGYAPEEASDLWNQIPLDTDIIITHTPAKYHCDESGNRGAAGCESLREALWRVRPRLAVCGHIHEARGVEIVEWDLNSPNVKFKELDIQPIADESGVTRKQFRVDLTLKSPHPLRNDGSIGNFVPAAQHTQSRGVEVDGAAESDNEYALPSRHLSKLSLRSQMAALPKPPPPQLPFPRFEKAQRPISSMVQYSNGTSPKQKSSRRLSTVGQGAISTCPTLARSDEAALSGREGRKETCIVNAAIMAKSWPHKAGKTFNKPIVVDLDLPIDADNNDWIAEAVMEDSRVHEKD